MDDEGFEPTTPEVLSAQTLLLEIGLSFPSYPTRLQQPHPKNMKKSLPLIALLIACSTLSAFAQNLVPNGDFSNGLTDWNLTEGTVTPVNPSVGVYGAEFSNAGESAILSSLLNTVVGQQYTLSFDTYNLGDGDYFISLISNGIFHDSEWDGFPESPAPAVAGAHSFSFNYIAQADDIIYISYSGTDPGTVSNVSVVTAVPEPSSMALLGLAAVGGYLIRRKKA